MAESLVRSEISFRRQGSSGLVWDDKQLLNGEFLAANTSKSGDALPAPATEEARPYKAVKIPSPSEDPPSPKVSGCGLCGMFGKAVQPNKQNNRRS